MSNFYWLHLFEVDDGKANLAGKLLCVEYSSRRESKKKTHVGLCSFHVIIVMITLGTIVSLKYSNRIATPAVS